MPPVPWRWIAGGAAALAIALLAAAALLVPGILDDRDRAGDRAREAAQRRHEQALRTADREQRPRTGSGAADPGEGAPAASRTRARAALLAGAHRALRRDAAGRGDGRVRGLDCEPFPRGSAPRPPVGDLAKAEAVYQCIAVTSTLRRGRGRARRDRHPVPARRALRRGPLRVLPRRPAVGPRPPRPPAAGRLPALTRVTRRASSRTRRRPCSSPSSARCSGCPRRRRSPAACARAAGRARTRRGRCCTCRPTGSRHRR